MARHYIIVVEGVPSCAEKAPWNVLLEKREERTPPPCFPNKGILIGVLEIGLPRFAFPFWPFS